MKSFKGKFMIGLRHDKFSGKKGYILCGFMGGDDLPILDETGRFCAVMLEVHIKQASLIQQIEPTGPEDFLEFHLANAGCCLPGGSINESKVFWKELLDGYDGNEFERLVDAGLCAAYLEEEK